MLLPNMLTDTNMPTNVGKYAKHMIDLNGRHIHMGVPQWVLYTYLTCITEQIWLPHDTYIFQCTATVVHL